MKELLKKCKYCGEEFATTSKIRQCCSSECSHKFGAEVAKLRGNGFKRQYNIDDDFLNKDVNEKYYFLGLMASDGSLSERNHTISISQSGNNGLDLLQYIKKILNTNYSILTSTPKIGQIVYQLSMRSKKLWEELLINNVKPRKTYNFQIPNYILKDFNKLRYFLIGYIDGDGCIGVYKNMLSISFVCSPNMKEQLSKLPLFKNARFCFKKSVIDIRFNGIKALKFCEQIYKNISVYKSYKYKKFILYKQQMFNISPKIKYNFIREEIKQEFDKNPNLNCMQYAKEHNINFQYVYKIRKQWREENE